MKSLYTNLTLLLLLFFYTPTFALDYYWVGGSGMWSDHNNHWATTSGGNTFHDQVPQSMDNVYFDANSFPVPGGTVTIDQTIIYCMDMDWTGAVAGAKLSGPGDKQVWIFGSLKLESNIIWDIQGEMHLRAFQVGKTITSSGTQFGCKIYFDGVGGEWSLLDDFYNFSYTYLENGTLRTNNHKLDSYGFLSDNQHLRGLYLGSSTVTVISNFSFSYVTSNLTFDAGTSHLILRNSQSQFYGGSQDFYRITFEATPYSGFNYFFNANVADKVTFGNNVQLNPNGFNNFFHEAEFQQDGTIGGNNTFDNLTFSSGKVYKLGAGNTQFITDNGTINASGDCSNFITIFSTNPGQTTTISKSSGNVNLSKVAFRDNIATGGAIFNADNSADIANNSGWNFMSMPMRDLHWVNGAGNWNDINHWSLNSGGPGGECIPTPFDNVYFDQNSGFATGDLVKLDANLSFCNDMSWEGVSGNPSFSSNNNNSKILFVYGSLLLDPGVNILPLISEIHLMATGPGKTITSAGKQFACRIYFDGVGGEWSLLDDFYNFSYTYLENGTLRTNNHKLDSYGFLSDNQHLRGLYLGSSTVTVISNFSFSYVASNLTFDAGTSHLILRNSQSQFYGGSQDFYRITFEATPYSGFNYFFNANVADKVTFGNNVQLNPNGFNNFFHEAEFQQDGTIGGNNTFDNLTFSSGKVYKLGAGNTQFITDNGTINASGDCSNFITIFSTNPGQTTTISKSSGNVNLSKVAFRDNIATGGAIFNADNSADIANNSGWNFMSMPMRDLHWVNGAGNWNDINHWSLNSGGPGGECIPTPFDNVYFDQNSGFATGDLVKLDANLSFCNDMSWEGVSGNPSFSSNNNNSKILFVYGSLLLDPGVNILPLISEIHLMATGPGKTITSAGKQFACRIYFDGVGGEWSLLDDFYNFSYTYLENGTLRTNNHKLDSYGFLSDNQHLRGLYLGSSTVTVISNFSFSYVASNLTFDAGTSHLILRNSQSQFYGGSQDFYRITFEATPYSGFNYFFNANVADKVTFGNNVQLNPNGFNNFFHEAEFQQDGTIGGNNTFDNLTFSPGKTYISSANSTQTITPLGNFIAEGYGGFPIEIKSSQLGTQATLHKDGDPICLDFLYMTDIAATGTGFTYAGANSDDVFNNSGWLFQACPSCFTDPPLPAPTLDPASITTVNVGDQAHLILENLPTGYEAVWFDAALQNELYASTDNNFQPVITQATTFYGAFRELSTGCISDLLEVQVYVATPLILTETHVNVLCHGGSTGLIDLSVTGGTLPYTYFWTGGATTQDVSGLAVGTYSVTVTDVNASTKTLSVTITQPTVIVLSTTVTPVCSGGNNGTIDLTVSGGTGPYTYLWTGGATTEDLAGLGAGSYTVIVTDANGCTKTTSATILQSPIINLSTTSTNTCTGTSVGTIDLTVAGGTPGFTYAWSNNATTQDLTNLAAGTYTVTVTDANTCTNTISQTVVANPVPTVNAVASQAVCAGASTAAINFSGTPAGVTFNWTNNNTSIGLAANGTGNIASFVAVNNGLVPEVATITVTPSITAGGTTCLGTAITFTYTIYPLPTLFMITGGGLVCTTDNIGVPVGLSGSQVNVNYQLQHNAVNVGTPVAGTGNAISFGTQLLAGTYTVIATSIQGACTRQMASSVTVATFDCSVAISDPCVCLNNATTLFNGQFGEVIKVNAPGTQVWTVSAINGLFQNPSPAPPAAPNPIPLGTVLTNLGVAMNMFQLSGLHVDAIGYTISVTNGAGTTLMIGNTCEYPNPAITSDLSGDFCLFSNPVNLTGTPGDANIVSQGFTVNGVPATQFDPGQGPGQYLVVYTVNGGVPKAFGPNDPGCIQSVSLFVNVVATPSNLSCNDLVYLSLDADCTEEILPDMILEGTYGCFDDYIVEIDKTLPYGNGPWEPAVVGTSDIGKTYQVRVTHLVSGNMCWGNIKIEDKLAPTLICEPFSVPCNTLDFTPDYLFNVLNIPEAIPTATDCQSLTLSYIDTETLQNCASGLTKIITRKWTATDASGNSATCEQIISVLRPTFADLILPPNYDGIVAPYFDCSAAYPSPDWIESQGLQGYPWYFGNPAGCSINWAYHDVLIEVCDGTYKIVREWTIIDWCQGIPFHYYQIIKVADDEGPSMDCPANLTVSTDPFTCCATINLPDIIVEDNCSRINNIGGMIVVREQYTGQVINMVPIGGTLEDFPGNNWWDRDTLANFGWTPCLPPGEHTVTYIVQDDCGNSSQCNFDLTVRDYVPPVAACDETTTVALGPNDPFDCYDGSNGCDFGGVTWVRATTFDDGSYDNCNGVKFTIRRMDPYSDCINDLCESFLATAESDSIKFYCCEVGTIQTVILAVYQVDVNGNLMPGPDGEPIKNECMIQVEVQDKLKPVCLPPANVTVNCENFDPSLWAYGKPVVADNCCLDTSLVYQGQCGLTHTVNYSLFDTVCNRGTITRTFRAWDCHGFSSQCTQRVFVTYEQDYFIKFPNDAIVTVCDGTGTYGEPIFFGEDCELLGVSFEDEIFTVVPDACFKIERTWTIINWCTYNPNLDCIYVPNPNPNPITNHPTNLPGPTVSECGTLPPWAPTVVRINPTDPTTTNFCTFWDADANCYKYKQIIKIIDNQAPTATYVVPDCTNQNWLTPNNPQLWNEMYWWNNGIQTHDLCEEPTDLCITGTDACSGANINIEYLLFLDLDGDGIMETVVNSTSLGIAGLGWNNVLYGNLNTPNFTGGTPRQFDERPVPNNQKWGFSIQETITGNTKTACVRWNTQQQQNTHVVPELPHGTHKIKWFITDGCGNNAEYEYTFTVRDCKPPTVVCINGLSVNIMPTGMITLWASDFLQYTEDNCTPAGQIKIGIRKCGTGTGFPVDAQGNPILFVTFDCTELGTRCVELWAIDAQGNADFCETYLIVQDNFGVCPSANHINVAGALKTELEEGVEEATVHISGTSSLAPPYTFLDMSDSTGFYAVLNAVPLDATFVIAPEKDDNPLNGVTTYDLVLISKHILGIEPLDSPYKMIAADANKSGSITTFDIVEIRKLILGIYTDLPNNTSWRFVDKAFVFPNVLNPFQTLFPETISIADAMVSQMDEDFVGVKIGDVNNTTIANAKMSAEDRTAATALFDVEDRHVKAGETFDVTFEAAEQLKGFQFTMLHNGLEMVGLTERDQVSAHNFGKFEDATTVSIDGAQSFTLRFKALKSGKLSEMLGVSGAITRAEAYSDAGRLGIAFRFSGKTISGIGFELYQNQPNPFVNKTSIGFFLPAAAEATLSIFDETGRVVYQQKGQFAKGENTIALDRPDFSGINTTGILYYKLETDTDSDTKKMIQAK